MKSSPGPVPPDLLIGTTWLDVPPSPILHTYCLRRWFTFPLVDAQNLGDLAHLYGLVLERGRVRAPRMDFPGPGKVTE